MTDNYDVLSFDLKKQTQVLLDQLPPSYTTPLRDAETPSQLLTVLSTLLAVPSLTLAVATAFRPLLLDLCSRWLLNPGGREERLEAFGLLLDIHPEIYP